MIKSHFNQIAIIGLGYVGLPLCIRFCESGINVIGLDVDQDKVDAINDGKSYIKHIDPVTMKNLPEGRPKHPLLEARFDHVMQPFQPLGQRLTFPMSWKPSSIRQGGFKQKKKTGCFRVNNLSGDR